MRAEIITTVCRKYFFFPIDAKLDIYDVRHNRELLDVKLEESRLGLEVSGLVSNANYSVKRAVFLLFINSRCFI